MQDNAAKQADILVQCRRVALPLVPPLALVKHQLPSLICATTTNSITLGGILPEDGAPCAENFRHQTERDLPHYANQRSASIMRAASAIGGTVRSLFDEKEPSDRAAVMPSTSIRKTENDPQCRVLLVWFVASGKGLS